MLNSGDVAVIIFISSIVLGGLYITFGVGPTKKLWRWLKGSRKTYYLGVNQRVVYSPENYRGSINPIIEISRGLFRRRSTIYGDTANSWFIVRDWFDPILDAFHGDWVSLVDSRGLPIENALRLINTYSSLQAMLDRIAELEGELVRERSRRVESVAVLQALNIKILEDKQRFRSPVAKGIRDKITFALREMCEVNTYHQPVDLWLEKLSKPEIN